MVGGTRLSGWRLNRNTGWVEPEMKDLVGGEGRVGGA